MEISTIEQNESGTKSSLSLQNKFNYVQKHFQSTPQLHVIKDDVSLLRSQIDCLENAYFTLAKQKEQSTQQQPPQRILMLEQQLLVFKSENKSLKKQVQRLELQLNSLRNQNQRVINQSRIEISDLQIQLHNKSKEVQDQQSKLNKAFQKSDDQKESQIQIIQEQLSELMTTLTPSLTRLMDCLQLKQLYQFEDIPQLINLACDKLIAPQPQSPKKYQKSTQTIEQQSLSQQVRQKIGCCKYSTVVEKMDKSPSLIRLYK